MTFEQARDFTRCVRRDSGISVQSKEDGMPNHKQRKKKGGRNKSKKVKAMRLSVETRRGERRGELTRGRFRKGLADQPDRQAFKPGSANDLYSRKAA